MMLVLLKIAIALVLLVVAVVVVGASLPVGHTAMRSIELRQPPDAVYAVVRDVASYAQWWSEVSRVEMLEPNEGRVRFREHTGSGPIVMEIVGDEPAHRVVTRIADPEQPFGGTWTFEVAQTPGGARLTITEDGEVYNVLFRFMARFVFGYTATMESYLRALGAKFGEDVAPV